MYKDKVCGVDIRVGDMLKDHRGNTCIVYKLRRFSDRGETIISFYWISIYGNLYDECVGETGFASIFKEKLKI